MTGMRKILQLLLKMLSIVWKIILVIIALIFAAITFVEPLRPIFWLGYLCMAIGEYFKLNDKTIRLGKHILTPEKIDKITLRCFIVICIITLCQYPDIVKQIIFHNSQL